MDIVDIVAARLFKPLHSDTTINKVHIFLVGPALKVGFVNSIVSISLILIFLFEIYLLASIKTTVYIYLSTKPQYFKAFPYIAGGIALYHTGKIYQKFTSKPEPAAPVAVPQPAAHH